MGEREKARRMYLRGATPTEIAEALPVSATEVRMWASRHGWADEREAARAEQVAREMAREDAADERYRQLAEAIQGLAASIAAKAKQRSLAARDVLDLAKATELSQRIRERTRKGTTTRPPRAS